MILHKNSSILENVKLPRAYGEVFGNLKVCIQKEQTIGFGICRHTREHSEDFCKDYFVIKEAEIHKRIEIAKNDNFKEPTLLATLSFIWEVYKYDRQRYKSLNVDFEPKERI